MLCSVLTLAGYSGASGSAQAPGAPPKKCSAIQREKPAFPLKAHLESADIAAGKYKAAEFIDFGADLFPRRSTGSTVSEWPWVRRGSK